jgi:NAD(P)-dependent dehydrogenase (short-subunit alcohol dehydrogenase family)
VPRTPIDVLHDRVILVTGANRGIGAAFVEAVLDAGAARVYACARDPRSLEPATYRHGTRLVPVELDVTDAAQVERACRSVSDVDLFVSNAGREGSGRMVGHDEADARDLFEVHLWGPWRLADRLAPMIGARAGGMIFVQSIAALVLSRRGPFYSASKAAATMMSTALRESLRDDGVTVTNVFPGFTDTDMMSAEDVPKASPRQIADRALAGWAAGEASVFPDRFARLVHERMQRDIDEVLDRPAWVVTEEYLRYVASGDAT